jgi:hypothetical protein
VHTVGPPSNLSWPTPSRSRTIDARGYCNQLQPSERVLSLGHIIRKPAIAAVRFVWTLALLCLSRSLLPGPSNGEVGCFQSLPIYPARDGERNPDINLRAVCGWTAIPGDVLHLILDTSFLGLRAYRGRCGKRSAGHFPCRRRERHTRVRPWCLSR